MELVLLRTLLAVVEAGSFSTAATRLCITQSAVSRRIKQLEDHYGTALLDRSGPAVQPTEAGRGVIERAGRMLELEREIEETVGAHVQRHRISFCCTPGFGTGRLPDIFERFVSAQPTNIDLNVVFRMPEDVLGGLDEGRFDLAVIEHCDDLDLKGFPAFPLPDDEMLFVSAPSFGLEGEVLPVDRLAAQRLYLKSRDGCAYRFLKRGLRLIGHSIEEFGNCAYFDDLAIVVRQVIAGKGIGFVSRELARREIESGLLRIHRVVGFDHRRPRTLVMAPRLRATETTLQFARTIFETLGLPVPAALGPGPAAGGAGSRV